MTSFSPTPNSGDAALGAADAGPHVAGSALEVGILQVEVPHWSAHVSVFDNENQLVSGHFAVAQNEEPRQRYAAEFRLPAGIYHVETALAGDTTRELVPVRANHTTRVAQDRETPQTPLTLTSSIPLAGTTSTRERHAAAAEEWSRSSTWPDSVGGDSRLFIFVRTLDPDPDPTFASGLKLLDADGRLVTDFSEGVRRNTREGWTAFNSDLPSGSYILRRGGRHRSLRFQSLYLTAGWDTQLFLLAERDRRQRAIYPRLHSLMLNMSPLGAGFRTDDELALAATVLLDGLSGGLSGDLVIAEQMASLLSGQLENPMLNLVGAHVLQSSLQERSSHARVVEEEASRQKLLDHVLSVLVPLHKHPDIAALLLTHNPEANGVAASPFWSPPILRRSLELINALGTRDAKTIPEGSLTDLVLDAVIIGSPWTAWHTLHRLPAPDPVNESRVGRGRRLLKSHPAGGDVEKTITQISAALARGSSPAAPVNYQAASPQDSDLQVAAVLPAVLAQAGTVPDAAGDDPTVQVAQTLIRPGSAHSVPDSIVVDVTGNMERVLGAVDVQQVSTSVGLPRSRMEQALEGLRTPPTGDDSGDAPGPAAAAPLTPLQGMVLETALEQSLLPITRALTGGAAPSIAATAVRSAAELPQPPEADAPSPVFIEESVPKLLDGAEYLRAAADRAPKGAHESSSGARATAERLHRIADALLAAADYTVLTDPEGRIVFDNGAFDALMSHATLPANNRKKKSFTLDQRETAGRAAWETALAKMPLGSSPIEVPQGFAHHAGEEWHLQRTEVIDESSGQIQAYLNVLNNPHGQRLSGAKLRRIAPLVSELSVSVLLFADGSPDHRGQNLDDIDALAEKLERIVGIDTA